MSKGEFGEPWAMGADDKPLIGAAGSKIQFEQGIRPLNQRVIECVNAMDGLDPSAIPELVRAARAIVARLNHRRHGGSMTVEENAAYDELRDAVKKVEGK